MLAGMAGVDPAPWSLWELWAMAKGAWERTAAIMGATLQPWIEDPPDPRDYNPFNQLTAAELAADNLERCRAQVAQAAKATAKGG